MELEEEVHSPLNGGGEEPLRLDGIGRLFLLLFFTPSQLHLLITFIDTPTLLSHIITEPLSPATSYLNSLVPQVSSSELLGMPAATMFLLQGKDHVPARLKRTPADRHGCCKPQTTMQETCVWQTPFDHMMETYKPT